VRGDLKTRQGLIAVARRRVAHAIFGYRVESYKLFYSRCRPAWPALPAALYVPQVGIINPGEFAPGIPSKR